MENFLGINPTDTYDSADELPLPLGTEARKQKKVYRMVLASESITANDFVIVDPEDNTALQLDQTSASNHGLVGVAETAITSGDYGWVTVFGIVDAANVTTGATDRATLYTTSTGGRLDDDGTDQYLVYNVVPLDAAASNEAECFLDHPHLASGAKAVPDFTATSSTAEFGLGVIKWDGDKAYMYAQADGGIDVNNWVAVTSAGQADQLDTGNDDAGVAVGVAETAISDDDYGWITVNGYVAEADCLVSCARGALLYATATAGAVDDAAGGNPIMGAYMLETEGGTGADDLKAVLTFPRVYVAT